MIAVDSSDAFLASPVGHCLVRDGYLMWCASPSLAGLIHWGSLHSGFIEELIELGSHLVLSRLVTPRVLCDFRDLGTIHLEDVIAFIERTRTPRLLRAHIGGLTVVLPGGLPGIIVAGATVALTSVPRLVFTSEISHALSSVGHDAVAGYAAIEDIAINARGTSLIVTRLRNHIVGNLAGATIESCAAALRTSARSLQRSLRAAGTSFTEQLRRARIDAACQLVRFSDLKIDAVAARVGFGNASRMGSVFRAEFGLTPSQLRHPASGT